MFYEGSKAFWKSKVNLEIKIIEHKSLDCFELIAYDPDLDQEAPRIYLSSALVSSKINQHDFHEKVSAEKEAMIRKKKTFDINAMSKQITHDMIVKYILCRISIPENLESGSFHIVLLTNIGDVLNEKTQLLDFIINKPMKLKPFQVEHVRNVR